MQEDLSEIHCRRLLALAHHSYDFLWEARVEGPGLEGEITFQRDVGPDLGMAPGELPRVSPIGFFLERFHPDEREEEIRVRREAIEGLESYHTTFRLRTAGGGYTWWEEHGLPPVEGDPEAKWLGAARNITARREAEHERDRAFAELEEMKDRLERENIYLREEFRRLDQFQELVGDSPQFRRVLEQVEQVAETAATVLVTGETGTGKELVAKAIHRLSPRRERPMIVVNCGALPSTLIESELFGHERGAFTGAVSQRIGRFEAAHEGTLFLDEVGELPMDLQSKLLRVLEAGELQRVGSNQARKVDVRVIAATNRDLERAAEEGDFRADLLYRLNVFPIEIPPLRDRREDIPLLATYLAEKRAHALGRKIERIPRRVMEVLEANEWPGNVRELENVIDRAIILSKGPTLELAAPLRCRIATPAEPSEATPERVEGPPSAPGPTLQELERDHILRVCHDCDWRIKGPGGAAERLGLNPSTLYFRFKKLGIDRSSPRP